MKILCISDAWLPQINGVVRTYQNLGRELEKMGHRFSVIGPTRFRFTLPAPTYPEIRLAVFARWSLPALIDAEAPEAIHIATEGPLGRAARRYCLKRGITFTTCYHTQFPEYLARRLPWPIMSDWIKRTAIRSLQKFHAPAQVVMVASAGLEVYLRNQGYPGPFHRLSRGVDSTLFKPGLAVDYPALKKPVAIYVGRVALEKNIETFLDADWPGSKVVVGHGPALAALRHTYPHVHFTGLQEGAELAAWYRVGDVFAFPSQTETFGVVLLEALASGVPVAATPVMGPRDIIDRDFLGALNADFTEALTRALQTPGTPAERAAYISTTYTWEQAARQFLAGLACK